MYITRKILHEAIEWVKNYLMYMDNNLYNICVSVLRTDNFSINIENHPTLLLKNVLLMSNLDMHWAETDGEYIWLNVLKPYTNDTLRWTILHEVLHGMVKRNHIYDIPEDKEHKIMELLDYRLI
jgi:hypothetical protein